MESFRQRLGLRLRVAYLTFHRRAQAHFAQFGLTSDQWVMLSLLAEEDGVTQRELVLRSGSDSSTIGAMMKVLERQNLVRRLPHEMDGRAVRVRLTAKGRRMHTRLEKSIESIKQDLYGSLPSGSLDIVLAALDAIAESMDPQQKEQTTSL